MCIIAVTSEGDAPMHPLHCAGQDGEVSQHSGSWQKRHSNPKPFGEQRLQSEITCSYCTWIDSDIPNPSPCPADSVRTAASKHQSTTTHNTRRVSHFLGSATSSFDLVWPDKSAHVDFNGGTLLLSLHENVLCNDFSRYDEKFKILKLKNHSLFTTFLKPGAGARTKQCWSNNWR